MRRALSISLVLLVAIVAGHATPALASPHAQPTDPNAGSPAGVVYAIPTEGARQDAEPHGHHAAATSGGGSSAGGGGQSSAGPATGAGTSPATGGGTSPATGGGTSATAGGVSASGGAPGGSSGGTGHGRRHGKAAAGRGSDRRGGSAGSRASAGSRFTRDGSRVPVLVPGGQPGSLVHSGDGFGTSPTVPGYNASSSVGLGSVQGNASSAPLLAIVLAALLAGVGVFLGVRTRRTAPPEPQ